MRAIGVLVSLGMATAAVWLIVKADSTRSIQLGVLAGLWGALLAGFVLFGSRRAHVEQLDNTFVGMTQRDVALRRSYEVERERDAAARREYELRLEVMLRREVEKALSEQLANLRSDVNALRNDLVEKVGGQLRLERIETTRLIGSDLEALQEEVRRLVAIRESAREPAALRSVAEHGGVVSLPGRPEAQSSAHWSTPTTSRVRPGQSESSGQTGPESGGRPRPRPVQPVPNQTPAPPTAPPAPGQLPPNGAQTSASPPHPGAQQQDPFAGLPRLSPYDDFDETPTTARPPDVAAVEPNARPPRSFIGRRRRTESAEDILARLLAERGMD